MVTEQVDERLANGHQRRTVLVVEDETFVRWAVAEALRDIGYHVIEAASGDEAADIMRAGVPFDLAFSDVRMPGSLDGLALLELIRAARPDIPVLITSGHAEPASVLASGANCFLRKPYEVQKLIGLIEDALGRPT